MTQRMQVTAWITGLLLFTATPIVAQTTFKTLTLNQETTSGTLMGSTGGTTSLPAIVGDRDRKNQKCLGFGDPSPDHTLVLQKPVSTLTLRVDSGGSETTLLISGPGGVRCASGAGRDARLQDTGWQPGTYQIWVGNLEPGPSRDYRLTVRGN